MSDFGLLSVNLDKTSSHLRGFNNAIDHFRKNPNALDDETVQSIKKLLAVLVPLSRLLNGELPKSISIDEESIIEILQQKHSDNWQNCKSLISAVTKKLENSTIPLNQQDIECLDDVADALDAECAQLFMRLKG